MTTVQNSSCVNGKHESIYFYLHAVMANSKCKLGEIMVTWSLLPFAVFRKYES